MQISEEKISENREKIKTLVFNHFENPEKVFNYMDNSDFFTAPASKATHLAVKGGLAQHSLNVVNLAIDIDTLLSKYTNSRSMSDTDCVVGGTAHDFCKIDEYDVNSYPFSDEPYVSRHFEPLGHGTKSLDRLLRVEPNASTRQKMLVRWHWMYYDNEFIRNDKAVLSQFPEVSIIHTADLLSAIWLEEHHGPKFNEKR